VSGGIAAYKSADVVRRLRERGCEVRVVMTAAAREFVTPLTLQAVSGNPVHTELLDDRAEAAMGHIELARWADRVLIAPATADVMARIAHGLAPDLLTTLCLATEAPLVLAPAMNRQMWAAAATRANLEVLLARGVLVIGPGDGSQACGEVGAGRMIEPVDIAEQTMAPATTGRLAGLDVLVTAGPTREAIDPVRFLSNHSSGKMGYAVAAAARAAGARVTLVSGPTALPSPPGVERVNVVSALEMHSAVMERASHARVFFATAAVADYRPARSAPGKIKKDAPGLELSLVRNPDILCEVAALRPGPFTVGFAAETENLEANARAKLEDKGLDLIAANQVGSAGTGFDADDNALVVLWRTGSRDLGTASKIELARGLVALVAERLGGDAQG
jgi:phosphopantothenoylcysteine decarboxylase / phosphopantothenate---cysteine ligase